MIDPSGPRSRNHLADDSKYEVPFRYLRGRCPCASCVNEFTGERMVDVGDIPEAIEIEAAKFAGNYALKITWNDRHDTGLFTWEHLHELCTGAEWDRYLGQSDT